MSRESLCASTKANRCMSWVQLDNDYPQIICCVSGKNGVSFLNFLIIKILTFMAVMLVFFVHA